MDYNGSQRWSEAVNILSDEQSDIEMDVEMLLSDLTTNPKPKRFDGVPPVYEPQKMMVASIGSLTGILPILTISQTTVDRIYFYINDHLGTQQVVVDEAGKVVWTADYQPFGAVDVGSGSNVANNFRFAGQYFDEETGLHYNWHRYYDPKLGRYLTPDPIGLLGGINLYSYAWNNHSNLIDPFGLRGLGGDVGGSLNAFGFRFSFDWEIRLIQDSNRSLFDWRSWSLGITTTESHISWSDCPEARSIGFEVDFGTSLLFTNADSFDQLLGYSKTMFGSSGGYGPAGYNIEYVQMTDLLGNKTRRSDGRPVVELSLGVAPFTPGINYGWEAHRGNKNRTVPIIIIGGESPIF